MCDFAKDGAHSARVARVGTCLAIRVGDAHLEVVSAKRLLVKHADDDVAVVRSNCFLQLAVLALQLGCLSRNLAHVTARIADHQEVVGLLPVLGVDGSGVCAHQVDRVANARAAAKVDEPGFGWLPFHGALHRQLVRAAAVGDRAPADRAKAGEHGLKRGSVHRAATVDEK